MFPCWNHVLKPLYRRLPVKLLCYKELYNLPLEGCISAILLLHALLERACLPTVKAQAACVRESDRQTIKATLEGYYPIGSRYLLRMVLEVKVLPENR